MDGWDDDESNRFPSIAVNIEDGTVVGFQVRRYEGEELVVTNYEWRGGAATLIDEDRY